MKAKWTGPVAGGVSGLLAGAVALGVAELFAGVIGDAQASPVLAVGAAGITLTPEWLKELAIRHFGTNDKLFLLIGLGAGIAVLAVLVGITARWRFGGGLAGFAALGGVGAVAAVTRPTGGWTTAVPSIAGCLAGAAALTLLVRSPAHARPNSGTAPEDGTVPEGDAALRRDTALGRGPVPADDAVRAGGAAGSRRPLDGPAVAVRSRRGVLLAGAGTLAVAGLAGFGGRVVLGRRSVGAARRAVRLPRPASPAAPVPAGAQVRVPGMTPFVTANGDFYRVDTALTLPQVSPHDWTIRVHGMVDRPVELSFADLLRRPLLERDITLSCVSNQVGGRYAGNARWLGASLADLLRSAGVRGGAEQVLSRSADGFTVSTPIETIMDGRDALLAVGMNGEALPVAHGFPARLVVPGLYGYVSATKWVVDLKVTTFAADQAYWTRRGYRDHAPVKTLSRIDVPRAFARVKAGRVAVAGTAWAQHRGIEAVEVRVDGGPWKRAVLAPVPGLDTWRQWVLEWDAAPGSHRLEVRATDGTGAVQPRKRVPPIPDGATGWHSVVVTVI